MDPVVFTIETECQDCYKCVRHCHAKAIRIVDGKASVIPEGCVACGACVRVCPAHAKTIRSDLARLKRMLADGSRVYASIAPSHVGYFKGIGIRRLASALRRCGFAGVSETAHGAEAVSGRTCAYLAQMREPLVISSACPASVDFIRKYRPDFAKYLLPFYSPVLAHSRLLREKYGEDIKVVFFGPCAAKKNEADRNPELLNLALTFSSLERLLEDFHVDFDANESEPALGDAAEGRFYSIEGGMNDTLRGESRVRYLAVSGLANLDRLLSSRPDGAGARTIFLEALACDGGCVNGPVMREESASLETLALTDSVSSMNSSAGKHQNLPIGEKYEPQTAPIFLPDEESIQAALARVGKFGKADELNCGACGYNTCRDFAKALLEQKAEEAMCHNYLRKNFQRTSNALIKLIPAAVVIVDEKMTITECNRHFAVMVGETELFDSLDNLSPLEIERYLPEFVDIFQSILVNGGETEQFNRHWGERIVNLSVFSIAKNKYAGAVIQDVTRTEFKREQISEKAREVIQKNVLTVQKVARIFGEHIAETEIMLNEIAGVYRAGGNSAAEPGGEKYDE